jgi:phosphopantetheinyl transferase
MIARFLSDEELGPVGALAWIATGPTAGDAEARRYFDGREWSGLLEDRRPEKRRLQRIWGRVAAKAAAIEAIRRNGGRDVRPEALRIEPDAHGRPVLGWAGPGALECPAPGVSIAHTDGVAVGLAHVDPSRPIGVDVERVVPREPRFVELALEPGGLAWLDALATDPGTRAAWVARLWCAKEAAGKATGRGLVVGPGSVSIEGGEPATGTVLVALGPQLAGVAPGLAARVLRVRTGTRGDFAWAWTVGDVAGPGESTGRASAGP